MKISVLLDAEEFQRFNTYCEQQGFKKSTLIARLIRDHLDESMPEGNLRLPTNQERNR